MAYAERLNAERAYVGRAYAERIYAKGRTLKRPALKAERGLRKKIFGGKYSLQGKAG
jgi:hypothetical protein